MLKNYSIMKGESIMSNRANLFVILTIMLTIPFTAISECWDVAEISDLAFQELDGTIVFSFKDAVSCLPVTGAVVQVDNRSFNTDIKGYIYLPNSFFESIMDGTLNMTAKKDDYCTLKKDMSVKVGTVDNKRFIMSKQLPIGKARFVLQWGQKPKDLDLHLVGKDFHISYRNMRIVAQKAKLDRDDITSYGPETITLENIVPSHTYDLYVHNYSGESPIDRQAQVSVYKDNQLDRVVTLQKTKKRYVKILEIRHRKIKYINIETDAISK